MTAACQNIRALCTCTTVMLLVASSLAGVALGLSLAPSSFSAANDDVLQGRVVLDMEQVRPTTSKQFGIFFEEVRPQEDQISRSLTVQAYKIFVGLASFRAPLSWR